MLLYLSCPGILSHAEHTFSNAQYTSGYISVSFLQVQPRLCLTHLCQIIHLASPLHHNPPANLHVRLHSCPPTNSYVAPVMDAILQGGKPIKETLQTRPSRVKYGSCVFSCSLSSGVLCVLVCVVGTYMTRIQKSHFTIVYTGLIRH